MTKAARPRDVQDLCRLEQQGCPPQYLFFWGHRARRDGAIGRECLSQWWPATFTVDGLTYSSAEQFMMASKARLFGDEVTAERIMETTSPKMAKALGRSVKGFDEETWIANRCGIVIKGNVAKFGQDRDLFEYLIGTHHRVLVEATPDRIWGIGVAANDDRASQPSRWEGLNLLGFALMDARDLLIR
ncbi:MAG TPA: NADAR family protein [Pseudonocardiaceae bacterium]